MLVFLFVVAAVGGALNAVAGGGSFIALPALIYSGVPAVTANATSTLALCPGSMAAAIAYRRDIVAAPRWLASLIGISLIGGLLGALLLVKTSDTSFLRLLPWLMLFAAATFTFGRVSPATARRAWLVLLLQFVISIYGGYFGGGMGIMMLATLSLSGMTDIHEMNGLKSLLGAAINAISVVEFVIKRVIEWRAGLIMVAGGILGGYLGASMARRLDRRQVRRFVIAIAWTMTAYFFIR